MSEPEVNESSKDKNIVFDSANIAKNSENKANPFANLADAEAKAKAEEKQKADAEKAQQKAAEDKVKAEEKAHAEEVKKAAKTAEANEKAEEKARKNAKPTDATLQNMISGNEIAATDKTSEESKKSARSDKKGVAGFLWNGWHKFASIACVLIIIATALASMFLIEYPKNRAEDDGAAYVRSKQLVQEAREIQFHGEGYSAALRYIEKEIENGNDAEKIYFSAELAKYIVNETGSIESAREVIEPYVSKAQNAKEKEAIDLAILEIERIEEAE